MQEDHLASYRLKFYMHEGGSVFDSAVLIKIALVSFVALATR
jgi:hypothetical protein